MRREKSYLETTGALPELEQGFSPEEIAALSDREEPAGFYRGVRAEDVLKAIFGRLSLDAHPKEDAVGSRDNAAINLQDAIYFSPTSETRDGRKFLCTIGFDPLPDTKIEDSFLGRFTHRRITGPVVAKEVILRFAGEKPGQPSKELQYFSPRGFFDWYLENMAELELKEAA